MNDDLKFIKKHYGEGMMHLCRSLFSTLINDCPGALSKVLLEHFEPSRTLAVDIIENNLQYDFKNYIFSFTKNKEKTVKETEKTPSELLKKVGYNLFECKTEYDIQKFKKYYAKGEELCTFKGRRLNTCYVFFAIKDNIEEIKRRDFKNPERQDEYGTSVISIQFTKDDSHTLSIKNRYNHKVNNPDATFSNNLDNIALGLTQSFNKYYGLNQEVKRTDFEIPGYLIANDGKYYKYNSEINNIYYCPNNVIIDNFEVKRYAKEKYIVMDYFILDLVNKEIYTYDKSIEDDFENSFGKIKNIKILNSNDKNKKEVIISPEKERNIIVTLDKDSNIIKLVNNNIRKIGNNFLIYNESLEKVETLLLNEIGDYFLEKNNEIKELYLPNLKVVGRNFLGNNRILTNLLAVNLKKVDSGFLCSNQSIINLNLPNLELVGNSFLFENKLLEKVNLPNLKEVGDNFLFHNFRLRKFQLPSLKKAGDSFLTCNCFLHSFNCSTLEEVGDDFLVRNIKLRKLDFPKLEKTGSRFMDTLWLYDDHSLTNKINDIRYNRSNEKRGRKR